MPTLVPLPPLKKVRFGLFSVADVRVTDEKTTNWGYAGIQLQNLIGCGPGGTAVQPCDTPAPKDEFITPEFPEGEAFTAYAFATCAGPSLFNEGKQAAIDALNFNQERQVEKAVMTQLLADATDKTPGGAALPAQHGIALLEGLWGQYGGAFEPIFHLDRTVAHLGWGGLDRHGNHLETELGSQVAAGAGYFDPAYTEADGTSWIVVSGPMVIMQGVMQSHDPVFVQTLAAEDPEDPNITTMDNTWVALAERTFAWAYLCEPMKVQVNSLSGAGSL